MTHSQKSLVLRALESGPKTIWQLTEDLRISRPGARIFELKKHYTITDEWKEIQGRRVKVYTLEGHSDKPSTPYVIGANSHKPNKTFMGASTKGLLGPGVYGWRRGAKYLYIGMSKRLFRRLGGHDVVDRREALQDTDSLDFWFCESLAEAAKLEAILIEKYAPTHNGSRPPVEVGAERLSAFVEASRIVVNCALCGKQTERKSKARPAQNGELAFCSDAHRAKYHREHPSMGSLFEATA